LRAREGDSSSSRKIRDRKESFGKTKQKRNEKISFLLQVGAMESPGAEGDGLESPLLQAGDEGFEGAGDEKTKNPRVGFGRLLRLAKPDARFLVLGLTALFLRLPFSLAAPHFTSRAIGGAIAGDTGKALTNIRAFVVAGTVNAFLDFFNVFLFSFVQNRVVRRLRSVLFGKILSQEVGFFDEPENSSGALSSRLTSDCVAIGSDLSWVFRNVAEAAVRVGGIAAYLLIQNVRLGLVAVTAAPVVALFARRYGAWMARNAQQTQDALALANAVALQAIANKKTVASFANEPWEEKRHDEKLATWFALNNAQALVTGGYYALVYSFFSQLCVPGALLWYGVSLVLHGSMPPERLIAVMLYQAQLQEYVGNLLDAVVALFKSGGAASAAFALIDRKPAVCVSGDVIIPNDQLQGNVQLTNVTFTYPSRPNRVVLKRVTMTACANSKTALVGQSGSGKSTVIQLLLHFYEPQSGRVTIDGVDVAVLSKKWLHTVVGVVGQEPVLFAGSVLQNMTYSRLAREAERDGAKRNNREGLADEESLLRSENENHDENNTVHASVLAAARAANAHGFITQMPKGYFTEVGQGGSTLSGGQKQRVAIARAILQNPKVLLLDEATSSLDTVALRAVQSALDFVSHGRTTLTVAHRFSAIRGADFVYVVRNGEVVEAGTHSDLVNSHQNDRAPPSWSYRAMFASRDGEDGEENFEVGEDGDEDE